MYVHVTGEGKAGERVIHLLSDLIYRDLDRELIQVFNFPPPPGKTEIRDLRERWKSKSEFMLLF